MKAPSSAARGSRTGERSQVTRHESGHQTAVQLPAIVNGAGKPRRFQPRLDSKARNSWMPSGEDRDQLRSEMSWYAGRVRVVRVVTGDVGVIA